MPFDRTSAPDIPRITAYGEGWFVVNEERRTGSIIVSSSGLLTGWAVDALADFDAADLDVELPPDVDVVLLGTGDRHAFPDPARLARFHRLGVGVEIMSTAAACRTYNVLATEGRRILALLIVI